MFLFLLRITDSKEDIDRSSIPTPRRWINRYREAGHDRLFQNYFADEPVYNADIFLRRFRMRRHVFWWTKL
ncbi:hypothetical protein Ahy_A05g025119 [Arachis hypogaea]|uniref:Uncharacterized protein n=1 Tax=Arachis hypogaea TaxID=3818 RepID=A0A445D7X6_ARAHY|nr:hypothetical protein Ahy_A05g025119 [Arachis hypogaea]